MRIGFALPQVGSAVGPETLVTAAQRAEDLGFDSLWVLDRILWPINPRAPYPIGDGSLPVKYKSVLDPLETLTFVAAHTPHLAEYRPETSHQLPMQFASGRQAHRPPCKWEERGKRADELIQAHRPDVRGD